MKLNQFDYVRIGFLLLLVLLTALMIGNRLSRAGSPSSGGPGSQQCRGDADYGDPGNADFRYPGHNQSF